MEKAINIKVLFTDNDGTITDGRVSYTRFGVASKSYNLRDGMGVERLRVLAGIETIIITGEKCKIAARRARKLGVKAFLGVGDKGKVVNDYALKNGLELSCVAYIGDDVNDLSAINICGFSACPSDASLEVRSASDYISSNQARDGAFRDIAEFILQSKGLTHGFRR